FLKTEAAVLTLDQGEEARLDLRLTFPQEAAAKEGEKAIPPLLEGTRLAAQERRRMMEPGLREYPKTLQLLKEAENSLKNAAVRREGNVLSVSARLTNIASVTGEWIDKQNARVRRFQDAQNILRIGSAMRRYQDAHGHLPPAVVAGKDGKPLY